MPNITNWGKLTPKQQDHLTRIAEVTTDEQVQELFVEHKAYRTRYHSEPCSDCRAIAKVLGYEV